MALPKQVEKDLLELEAYEASLVPPPELTVVDTPAPPETPEPPADPPKPAPEAPPTADISPKIVEQQPPSEWEQKYRTLEGKYNAEVPRLHQQTKEMATQIQAMQYEITAQRQPKAAPEVPEELVSAKDVEEYGEDLIHLQRRVASEVMAPLKAELAMRDEQITELKQQLARTGGEVATMSFDQKLALEVPNFGAINTSPDWIAWLDELDPYTGEPRRAFAEFAYNNGDVAKVKRVVTQFLGSTVPPAATAPNQANQAELQRQITPTSANTAQTTAPTTSDRIYTEAQMVREFDRVRTLNVAGKLDEASKLEAELSNAYMQGRVRG